MYVCVLLVLPQCSAMTQADTLVRTLALARTTTYMNLSQTKAAMWRGCRLVRRPDSTPLVPVTLFHSLTLACPIFLLCERQSGTWKTNKQERTKTLT
jgi:hypothetical protein